MHQQRIFFYFIAIVFTFSLTFSSIIAQNEPSNTPTQNNDSHPSPDKEKVDYQLKIVFQNNDNDYVEAKTPVSPSFSHTWLKINKFHLDDLKWTDSKGYTATLNVTGICFSPLNNTLPKTDYHFAKGKAILNGNDLPIAEIPVEMAKTPGSNKVHGVFNVKIENAVVTEGLNTFRISVPDPMTAIEGGQTVTFVIEGRNTDTEILPPRVGKIEYLSEESQGESYPFFILAADVPKQFGNKIRITLGKGKAEQIFDLASLSTQDNHGYHLLGKNHKPMAFFLLPSKRKLNPEKVREAARKIQPLVIFNAKNKEPASEQYQFLAGYARGIFINGGDLITSDGDSIEGVVRFSNKSINGELHGQRLGTDGSGVTFLIPLPSNLGLNEMKSYGHSNMPYFLWQVSKLYREQDPRVEDVPISLLTDDYKSLGIESDLSGWRSNFLQKISEPLDAINSLYKEDKPFFHGFVVGMLVATASQTDLPQLNQKTTGKPTTPALMSEVLQHTLSLLELLPPERTRKLKVNVPEKYSNIWPLLSWYYSDMIWNDDPKSTASFANVLPDSVKHPLLPPIFAILAIAFILVGSIWFLVEEFKVSIGWGFGQLAANVISFCLIIPGIIVSLVFFIKYAEQATPPFLLIVLGFLSGVFTLLMIPAWTQPH